MSLLRRESLCLGAYLNFDKYPDPHVREYYNRMVSNIVHGLNVQMHRVDNIENLKRLTGSVRLTHLFVAAEEYESDPSYIEKLTGEMTVVVVADDDFALPEGSHTILLEKPFYCFPVTTILNMEPGYEQDNNRMRCIGLKALVVDDEPMNLTVARGIFRNYGMEVTTVLSGQAAIDICRKERFDIVFMDHMMPGMDGIEAMKAIRADKHGGAVDMPIIALTANAVSTAKEMFISVGFDGFVSKPIEIIELERVLKRVLPKSAITYESISKHVNRESDDNTGLQSGNKIEGGGTSPLSDAGIDMEAGLRYSQNDRELYETILKQFINEAPDKKKKISDSYKKEDYKDYEIYVHALKSTSRLIGASGLSERAKELEDKAKKGGNGITEEMHDEMMALYDKTVDAIKGWLDPGDDTVSCVMEFEPAPFVMEFEPESNENEE